MNLAILGSRGIPARYGAFEIFAERLASGLVARGWRVTVYCPHYQQYRSAAHQGIRLEYVWHPPRGVGSLLYDVFSLVRAAGKRHDLILMLGYGSSPFLWIPRLRGTPVVVNTDGLEWKRRKWSRVVRDYFRVAEWIVTRTADQLVSDSIGVRDYYRRKYGAESEYLAYGTELPPLDGETTDDVSGFGLEPRRYYLVVMRLEPENSILEIVEGFLESGATRPLVLVGPTTRFFERRVRPLLHGQDRVRFIGPVYDRPTLFALRRNAFAYVHGHTVGGTNPSLLEAMACANYVVARDVPFNREVVGALGRYFDSAESLAHILDDLDATTPDELRRWGLACREVVEQRFSWSDVVEGYAQLLERVARNGAPVRAGC